MQRNVENINTLIDSIRSEENHFSMAAFFEHEDAQAKTSASGWCGTPACIAGWSAWIASNGEIKVDETYARTDHKPADIDWTCTTAQEFLGLKNPDDAEMLFHGRDDSGVAPIGAITREEAILTLEKLRDTGEIDWSHAEFYKIHVSFEDL